MNNAKLVRQKQRLDSLFDKVRELGHDGELQAHWSRYLCVLVSGFTENSIRILLSEYAETKSHERVARFVTSRIRSFQNPNMNKILGLVRQFDDQWAEDLRRATEGELKAAIDSVVAVRHGIAHGASSGLSFGTIKDYYARVIRVVELIEAKVS